MPPRRSERRDLRQCHPVTRGSDARATRAAGASAAGRRRPEGWLPARRTKASITDGVKRARGPDRVTGVLGAGAGRVTSVGPPPATKQEGGAGGHDGWHDKGGGRTRGHRPRSPQGPEPVSSLLRPWQAADPGSGQGPGPDPAAARCAGELRQPRRRSGRGRMSGGCGPEENPPLWGRVAAAGPEQAPGIESAAGPAS